MENSSDAFWFFHHFDKFGGHLLMERGLRFGDIMRIMPCQGKEKKIRLNRTKYEISLAPNLKAEVDGNKIMLPSLGEDFLNFEMILGPEGADEVRARYLLKSINSVPFRLNSNFSMASFVERGDVIDIGHNRLRLFNEFECENGNYLQFKESTELLSNQQLLVSDLSILLEGETGTGKTLLAKMIHDESKRKGTFVHVNLSSFSESLIESELFGHVKGAFTGAICSKRGAFMQANHGTLFLDEIDSLPIPLQTKLLLSLESKMIRPVGGEETLNANVRLIFASGKKLETLVKNKLMREDFYYRIASGYRLELPSLRMNKENIKKACEWFMRVEDVIISAGLVDWYQGYAWPGNLRQLMSHLKRKKILTKGRKLYYDNMDEELMINSTDKVKVANNSLLKLEELKHRYIKHAYMSLDNNIEKTSLALGISRGTVKRNLKDKDQAAMII